MSIYSAANFLGGVVLGSCTQCIVGVTLMHFTASRTCGYNLASE